MNIQRGLAGIVTALLITAPGTGTAGWEDTLKGAAGQIQTQGGANRATGLSNVEMNDGLKEALAVGAERAIKGLGRTGGYLDDPSVRIPLPGALKKTEKALRMLGQDKVVDEFIVTVNRAAEQAIPQASRIVGNAVRDMSIQDARTILTGPDDAATRYFRDKTGGELTAALLPIVTRATASAGVTRSYKAMLDKAGPASSLAGDKLDVDAWVTRKALDGLFLKLADEERAIRTNPVARSSDLLKKVFGGKH